MRKLFVMWTVVAGLASACMNERAKDPVDLQPADTKDVIHDTGIDAPRVDEVPVELVPDVQDTGWWETEVDEWHLDLGEYAIHPDVEEEETPSTPDIPPEEIGPPPGVTVKELQTSEDSKTCTVQYGSMLVGVDKYLYGVVVTAPPYTFQPVEKLAGFYVADADGGAYSGIHVSFPQGDLPDVKPGMVFNIFGDHKEFFCFTVLSAKSLVLVSDAGPAPKPALTTPAEIAGEPEAYEGMLVRIDNVKVTSANPDESDGLDKHEFEVEGVLRVGNDYGLKYMNPATDARKEGDEFQYIIGVVKYWDKNIHVMPRFNSDMLLVGEVPPVEESPEVVEPTVDVVEVAPEVVPDVPPDVPEVPDVVEVVPDLLPDVPPEVFPDVPVDVPPDVPPVDVHPDVPIEPPSPIVITEIMYDPADVPDDLGEWVELYNASDDPIDLNGWRIESDDGDMHIIAPGAAFFIDPGMFVVLGNNDKESTNGGVEITYQYPKVDFAFMNTKDTIILKDLYGMLVDAVHYDEMGGWPAGKGASIALDDPLLDNDAPGNWSVATEAYGDGSNLGTPGLPNW